MKDRRRFFLFKQEVTEGVDPGLAGADAVKTTGVQCFPYEGNRVSLDYDKPNFGSSATVNVNPHMRVTFGLMMSSSGAAGTGPQWNEILQACGFNETLSVGVDAQYDAISDNISSGTGIFLLPQAAGVNDENHESNGMRGNMSFTLAAGAFPRFDIELIGSYVTPVEAAAVTADFTGWTDPIPPTIVNTPTVTIDGAASCLQSITHNCNNELNFENIPGCTGARIQDANFGGTMVIKAPDLTTKNFFTSLIRSDDSVKTGAVQIVHGTTAGSIIQLDYTTIHISGVQYTPINGDVGFSFNFVDVDNTLLITAK